MTRDIDILGRSFPGTEAEIIHRITAIAATEIDDGVAFDPATLKTVPIREEDEYHGLRLSMAASITRARLKLQPHVSFGDPVTPGPRIIDYPQQLTTDSFQILGYPLATVIAENPDLLHRLAPPTGPHRTRLPRTLHQRHPPGHRLRRHTPQRRRRHPHLTADAGAGTSSCTVRRRPATPWTPAVIHGRPRAHAIQLSDRPLSA